METIEKNIRKDYITKEKAKRIKFSNSGLFSSINILTTRLAMFDAIDIYGIGGDSFCYRRQEENKLEG
jgi:hypothetical protein